MERAKSSSFGERQKHQRNSKIRARWARAVTSARVAPRKHMDDTAFKLSCGVFGPNFNQLTSFPELSLHCLLSVRCFYTGKVKSISCNSKFLLFLLSHQKSNREPASGTWGVINIQKSSIRLIEPTFSKR